MLKKSKEQEMKERRIMDEFLARKTKGRTKERKAIRFYQDGGLSFPEEIIRKNLYLEQHDCKYWIPIFVYGTPLMLWVPEYSGLKPLFCPFVDGFWSYTEKKGVGRVEIKIRVTQIKTGVKKALVSLEKNLEKGYGFPYFELSCVNPLIIGFEENSFDSNTCRERHGC